MVRLAALRRFCNAAGMPSTPLDNRYVSQAQAVDWILKGVFTAVLTGTLVGTGLVAANQFIKYSQTSMIVKNGRKEIEEFVKQQKEESDNRMKAFIKQQRQESDDSMKAYMKQQQDEMKAYLDNVSKAGNKG